MDKGRAKVPPPPHIPTLASTTSSVPTNTSRSRRPPTGFARPAGALQAAALHLAGQAASRVAVIPDDIAEACYILSADLYKRRDSVGGVLGLSELGAIRMSPLGRDIAAMVRAYRREFFA